MAKRLVLFVEGKSDTGGVPVLVKRLLTEQAAWDCLYLDQAPFRVGEVSNLVGRQAGNWTRWLKGAAKRSNLGGVLLLLDGDVDTLEKRPFCAFRAGEDLARQARAVGAGGLFSVATVFAVKEFETWLIAGVESLAGKRLRDGRPGVKAGTRPPDGDLVRAPRDAKGWLGKHMVSGYKETSDQEALTELVDLEVVRKRGLRSFRRLESALRLLVEGIRTGKHIVSPAVPP